MKNDSRTKIEFACFVMYSCCGVVSLLICREHEVNFGIHLDDGELA